MARKSAADRQRRLRARQRDGEVVAPVPVNNAVVETIVNLVD